MKPSPNENESVLVYMVIVAVLVIVALFAPWIATYDVGATNLSMRYLPPSAEHWFGTDSTGRDIFSRVVYGARISLQVGIIVVVVSAFIGRFLVRLLRLLRWLGRSFFVRVTSSTCFSRFPVCCSQSRWWLSRRWS